MGTSGRIGPDVRLVAAARDGVPEALETLLTDSLALVYNVVGRALGGGADVDDVVQETVLRVIRYLRELHDPHAFRSWLVAITVRQIRDFQRRRRVALARDTSLDLAAEVPEPGSDFADLTVLRLGLTDQRREVAAATRWLDPDDRELLALWWLEAAGQLDRADLVAALDVPGAQVAVRIQRLKEQLRTARTVQRAVLDRAGCPELESVLASWDGVPGPLWRKRIARHARACDRCAAGVGDLVPVDRLLSGLPLVAVPAHLHDRAVAAVPGGSTAQPAPASPATLAARIGAVPIIGAAAVVVSAVVLAGYLLVPHPPAKSAAAPPAAPSVSSGGPSPDLSRSAVPPSAGPTPTPRPTVAAAPARTARKGVAAWSFAGASQALSQSGASWYYTWSTQHAGITSPPGVGFVPMIWGASSVTAAALAQAKAAGPYLLGFNEPDLAGQADMSVGGALNLWPQLVAAGQILGSPAVAVHADQPGGWLDQFMSGAASRGYRVDFVTLHWYGGDFVTSRAVDELRSYLQAVYSRYHKPIWLTEYALINFSGATPRYPTQDQQAAFVTASTQMLQGLPYLQRYAWFALPASDSAPTGLFLNGPQVTAVGRAFEAANG